MSKDSFYVTSPIFYPNANLHMGHAYVMTVCDILARYHRLIGDSTYFLTGSDENTGKVVEAAEKKHQDVENFLTEITDGFKKLFAELEISNDQFIRTSDKELHWPGAIAMWQALESAGDLYKGKYEGLYCPNCEAYYTEKDLIDGKCPYHGIVPEKIVEENYFFKLSKYTNDIKQKIESGELHIFPETRKNEILALLNRGLEDVSFSRPVKNVPHGIPVPNDPTQVIYVWCDALVNYISALGYGRDEKLFKKFWPATIHVIGKDILRFHAAIWPAMLMSAGLPLPKNILVHGLIISGGKKMSKSLGNVIDPHELINEYGSEAVRYYFAREVSPFEDGDLTKENFKSVYNANLANGLGNLVSRIMKMAVSYNVSDYTMASIKEVLGNSEIVAGYNKQFEQFAFNIAADFVWQKITKLDERIQKTEPFKLIKTDEKQAKTIVRELVEELWVIAILVSPYLPATAEKIKQSIKEFKMPEPLFLRK
jgi:methionyl-tRNA synthetase